MYCYLCSCFIFPFYVTSIKLTAFFHHLVVIRLFLSVCPLSSESIIARYHHRRYHSHPKPLLFSFSISLFYDLFSLSLIFSRFVTLFPFLFLLFATIYVHPVSLFASGKVYTFICFTIFLIFVWKCKLKDYMQPRCRF